MLHFEQIVRIAFCGKYMSLIKTRWILENIGAEGTDKVLFLARDSYILQKAFVALSENRYDNDYFYVSRKSTFGMRLTEDYSVKNIVSKAHLTKTL